MQERPFTTVVGKLGASAHHAAKGEGSLQWAMRYPGTTPRGVENPACRFPPVC